MLEALGNSEEELDRTGWGPARKGWWCARMGVSEGSAAKGPSLAGGWGPSEGVRGKLVGHCVPRLRVPVSGSGVHLCVGPTSKSEEFYWYDDLEKNTILPYTV
jgi:hypothetical protein